MESSYPFDTSYEFGAKVDGRTYQTAEKSTLSGLVRTAQNYTARLQWELTFKNQSDGFRKVYWPLFLNIVRGKLLPFYFLDVDASTLRYLKLDADYTPFTLMHYNLNDSVTLVMKTPEAIY